MHHGLQTYVRSWYSGICIVFPSVSLFNSLLLLCQSFGCLGFLGCFVFIPFLFFPPLFYFLPRSSHILPPSCLWIWFVLRSRWHGFLRAWVCFGLFPRWWFAVVPPSLSARTKTRLCRFGCGSRSRPLAWWTWLSLPSTVSGFLLARCSRFSGRILSRPLQTEWLWYMLALDLHLSCSLS